MSRTKEVHNGNHIANTVMSKVVARPPRVVPGMARPVSSQSIAPGSQLSKSAPSTPDQRPYDDSDNRRTSINGVVGHDTSPQSRHSGTSHTPPKTKRLTRHCKFETGMAQAKRRVPYSLGPEKLEHEPAEANKMLGDDENVRLTTGMTELYRQLLPSSESENRRTRFVDKLERLLQRRWPTSDTRVHVFGSTGNFLGTRDSDVDICITTDCREIEDVCSIAELLESNGMQGIVCVSSAKIPIVKAWDPEFQLACDINVNNPMALENTHMIRSYVAIDDRVRPLAMIIKHWAKRRMLNDAALGGTLSSYTWICMVLNFLQTRNPPILPALQQKTGLKAVVIGGVNVAFDKDVEAYECFGSQNKSSLGDLLHQFFRYFGHEFDYEHNALSVRLGKVVPKSQKAWHLLQDNRLCVEEPFNTTRNLANTADDTSMRGIHMELRRAFKLVTKGDLASCCEEFVPGPEERRQTATFIHPTARPIIPQPPSQQSAHNPRSNRTGYRGSRSNRNSAARRASNPAARNPNYLHDLPFQMTPQELQLQAQHQQHLLHDQLFQQYQFLQLQEQELRMQLYQQNLRQRGYVPSQTFPQPVDSSGRLPMSPTMYQNRFGGTSPYPHSTSPSTGIVTNPASPALSNVNPDSRRLTRRTSLASSAPVISPRAHSQPARSMPASSMFTQRHPGQAIMIDQQISTERRPSIVSSAQPPQRPYLQYRSESGTLYDVGRRPAEFVGYYIGQSPSLAARSQSTTISPIPSHSGLAIHYGGFSPKLSSQSSRMASGNNSPVLHHTSLTGDYNLLGSGTLPEHPESTELRNSLLLFDRPIVSPKRRQGHASNGLVGEIFPLSASTSEDMGIDTPSTSEDQFQDSNEKPVPAFSGHYHSHHVQADLSEPFQTLDIGQPGYEQGQPLGNNSSFPENKPHSEQGSQSLTPLLATTSPYQIQERQENVVSSSNGMAGKKKKTKTSSIQPNTKATVPEALLPKTNGQGIPASLSATSGVNENPSAWQSIPKKKKKGKKPNKSENDVSMLNSAGGELLPLDVSLRKGG